MNNKKIISIKKRLIIIILSISAFTLILASFFQILGSVYFNQDKLKHDLSVTAKSVAFQQASSLEFLDNITSNEIFLAFTLNATILSSCLYDDKNHLFSSYQKNDVNKCMPSFESKQITQSLLETTVVEPVLSFGEHIGILTLTASLNDIYVYLGKISFVSAFIFILAMSIAYHLASNLQRTITTPIRSLAKLVRNVSLTGAYNLRAEKSNLDAEDETTILIDGFNDMLSIIEERNENLVQARYIAEHANEVKTDFLANMSHEIRTPLNGVIGTSELLLSMNLAPQQKELANIIERSSKSLLAIINDVLDIAKIEADELVLEPSQINIEDLIIDIIHTFNGIALKKGVMLNISLEPSIPRIVTCDPVRLRQILVNLISNAIKFTSKGYVLIEVKFNRGVYKFSIIDTGIGIPPKQQEYIFQRFSQADSTTTKNYGGTGLGLAICAELCKLMAGTLTVKSTVGEGSEFSLSLSLEYEETETNYGVSKVLEYKKVFIINKDLISADILRDQLIFLKINATVFKSTLDALANIQNNKEPNFIFIESREMENDTPSLKKLYETTKASIILTSPYHTTVNTQKLNKLNIKAYINRPFYFDALKELLERLLLTDKTLLSKDIITTETQVHRLTHLHKVSNSEKLEILIAEDDIVNQMLMEKILKKMGHDTVIVENGAIAFDTFKQHKFDLVLMDMQMPILDGVDTTKKIRHYELENNLKKTKIIALTANALKEHQKLCAEAGMDDYFTKPITLEKIKEMIHGAA
tara:strand:+ start:223192 stop:225465 length:2274 start_codon:yes stop_codon:yes gene_type:complete